MESDCKELLDLLRNWYGEELAEDFPDCWVFGSLIYKDGTLFTNESDIDLVVRLPDAQNPIGRVSLLDRLRSSVQNVERQLLEALSREDASQHITSVISITGTELSLDIHKSKERDFFQSSDFLSLRTGSTSQLSETRNPESQSIPRAIIQSIEVCQDYRNKYVACAVNGGRKVASFDSPDPFPKVLMRSAAQVADFLSPRPATSKFDVNEGTLHLLSLLTEDKFGDTDALYTLREKCLQRIGRGNAVLDPSDVACLYELLFDQANELLLNESRRQTQDASADDSLKEDQASTVLAEAENEKVVWLLPRGIILIEDVDFEDSDSWSIVLNYHAFRGGWQGGTHYHSSYRAHWATPHGSRVQFEKLGIPPGDREFAFGALRLVDFLRKHDAPYDVAESITSLPNASKYARYFADGTPVIRKKLDDPYANYLVPARFRDVIAICEELKLAWRFDSVPPSEAHSAVQSLRHKSLVAVEEFLGKTAPSIRFVSEVIDAYDENADFSELKEWVDRLYETLFECLSAADNDETE